MQVRKNNENVKTSLANFLIRWAISFKNNGKMKKTSIW
jgi:hypothetical protein